MRSTSKTVHGPLGWVAGRENAAHVVIHFESPPSSLWDLRCWPVDALAPGELNKG